MFDRFAIACVQCLTVLLFTLFNVHQPSSPPIIIIIIIITRQDRTLNLPLRHDCWQHHFTPHSNRLEGLRVRVGVGIELWCSGTSAFVIECSPRNTDRLVNLLGELIALHQRTRRLRIVTGARCYFAVVETGSRAGHDDGGRRFTLAGGSASLLHDENAAQGGSTALSTRPTVVLREVWENQRLYPWVGFSPKLLPTDRGAWSSYDGTTSYGDLNAIRPSPGW